MQNPLPPDEIRRLKSLRRHAILDTPPEAAFDRIASLAARMLGMPMAAVTLVDEKRQWFKASSGLDLRETSREVSFCAHAILADDVLIVPDALNDRRFAHNPLVTGAPQIRFYAGYPLKAADGSKIGALCVIDTKPRELSAEDQAILRDLGEIGVNELQHRLEILERNGSAIAIDRMSTSEEQLIRIESQRLDLTNMIAHDMRSPLSVTLGFLDVLRTSAIGKLDQEDLDAIEYAAESAACVNGMITSMLELSRMEAGQMPMTVTECDLVALVKKSLKDLLALNRTDRLKLALPAESIPIRCDPQLTARVLLNLASNALKFTADDQEVRIIIARDEAQARVVVLDNGPGIAEEFHEKIFEKSGEAESTRKAHSTGPGLAFCKLAIEAQGGTVGVKSAVGIGSAFWFSFPQARAFHHPDSPQERALGRLRASDFATDVEWSDERVLLGISERMA